MPTLRINEFNKGETSSPYTADGAFSKSCNLDVFSQPGIARINYLPTGYSTNLTGLPIDFATNSNSSTLLYFADDGEDVYSFNTTTGAIIKVGDDKGNNVEYFNGKLYAIRKAVLNHYNFSSWSVLSETFTSLSATDNHFMFVSRNDGKLYICGSYSATGWGIASLATNDTWVQYAFTFPKDYKPISLTELGNYLIIAGKKVRGDTEIDIPETVYFFWDRSASTADKIISVPEKNMTVLFRRGDTIYVTGGEQGNVYRLTASGFVFYGQIPFDYDNKEVKIGVVNSTVGKNSSNAATWWKGKLMVGVSSADTLSPAGIYGIKDKVINHEFLPSHGDEGGTNDVFIGSVVSYVDGNLYYGWKRIVGEATTYGIDQVMPSNNRRGSYGTYLETSLYRLGGQFDSAHCQDVEIQLARPLQTGEGVRVKYRYTNSGSWTTLGTFDYATAGDKSNNFLRFGKANVQNIQFRIELTTGSTANTPYLREITMPFI